MWAFLMRCAKVPKSVNTIGQMKAFLPHVVSVFLRGICRLATERYRLLKNSSCSKSKTQLWYTGANQV